MMVTGTERGVNVFLDSARLLRSSEVSKCGLRSTETRAVVVAFRSEDVDHHFYGTTLSFLVFILFYKIKSGETIVTFPNKI